MPSDKEHMKDDLQDDPRGYAITLEELPSGYYLSKNFIGSAIGTCIMAIGLFTEYTMPTSSLTIINADIGPASNYVLISTIPSLISGIGLAVVGRLGDLFGRRYFLIFGQSLGLIGCIIGATAKSIPQLVGGGVLIGLAASVQQSFTYTVAELVPNKYRPLANGAIFLVTLPVTGFGPVFARMFIENTERGWRWFYYLCIIFAGTSLVLFLFFYFPPNFKQLQKSSKKRALKELDYGGLILYSAGLLLVLLGLSDGGTTYPWKSGHVIGMLVVGVVTIIIFALYETRVPLKQPFLPLELLKNRNYIAVCVTGSVATMVYFPMNVIWPQQIAALYSTNNTTIGLLSCTIGAGLVGGEVLGGVFFRPIGHASWQLLVACMAMTAFIGAMAASDRTNRPLAIAFTTCGTLAVGYIELAAQIMASLVCKPQDIGFAVGFLSSVRVICGSIATAIYTTILTNRLNTNIPTLVFPTAVSAGLPSSSLPNLALAIKAGTPEALQAVPGMTPAVLISVGEAVKVAYTLAFRTVYLSSIAFGACAVLAACFSKNVDRLMTSQVASRLRGTEEENGEERE